MKPWAKPIVPMTAEEFAALTTEQKGYVVYMRGSWPEEPNIPEHYEPAPEDRAEYEAGQRLAVQVAQDSEE